MDICVLGQVVESVVAAAGTGAVTTGLIVLILKRQANKVMEHPDDRSVHVNPDDPPIAGSLCEQIRKNADERHREMKNNHQEIKMQIASLYEIQERNTTMIIQAIQNGSGK